jgi:hypothetical protein
LRTNACRRSRNEQKSSGNCWCICRERGTRLLHDKGLTLYLHDTAATALDLQRESHSFCDPWLAYTPLALCSWKIPSAARQRKSTPCPSNMEAEPFRQVAVDMLQTARTNIGGQSLQHVNGELNAHNVPDSLSIAVDERGRLSVSWHAWLPSAVYQTSRRIAIDRPFRTDTSVWIGQWLIVLDNQLSDVRGGRHSD